MEENLKSASEWQGTDKYAGIDSYEKVVLKAGTELCALVSYKDGEMCPCAYLFPKNALEIVKDDDVLLNRMLQIAPWQNGTTKECSYRNELALFKLKRDVEFETGETAENTAYGMGGMTQYYIPEQKFIPLIKDNEYGIERISFENGNIAKFLSNNQIEKKEFDTIADRLAQLQLRRNLFCTQRAKLDTMDIIQNSPRQEDVELAIWNLKKIDGKIDQLHVDIRDSVEEIGKVPSPLYDSLNKQLAAEIKIREGKENVLVLGNAKVEQASNLTTAAVLDKTNLNVVTVVETDKAESIAQNLFKKIDGYDESKPWNDIDVKGQDLVDVMNINRINKECQKVMAEKSLRPCDFHALERLVLPTSDGKSKEYRIDELFDEKSVETIRSAQNGRLTEPLQMKNGQVAKLMMMGDKAHLFLAQPKECLNAKLDKMGLDDKERKRLLNGDTIAHKQTHVKLDKDLNCIVAGATGRLSTLKGTQTQAMDSPKVNRPKKRRGLSM